MRMAVGNRLEDGPGYYGEDIPDAPDAELVARYLVYRSSGGDKIDHFEQLWAELKASNGQDEVRKFAEELLSLIDIDYPIEGVRDLHRG